MPRAVVAAIAVFAMFGSSPAKSRAEHTPLSSDQIQKIGYLAAAADMSTATVAPPPETVHHNDTIHGHKHHLTPAEWAAKQVSPTEFRAWKKVNICEESGNWHIRGDTYSGGLGISNYNWDYYRPDFFPGNAADATPAEQIVVAERIQPNPPDQHGCERDGW